MKEVKATDLPQEAFLSSLLILTTSRLGIAASVLKHLDKSSAFKAKQQ